MRIRDLQRVKGVGVRVREWGLSYWLSECGGWDIGGVWGVENQRSAKGQGCGGEGKGVGFELLIIKVCGWGMGC